MGWTGWLGSGEKAGADNGEHLFEEFLGGCSDSFDASRAAINRLRLLAHDETRQSTFSGNRHVKGRAPVRMGDWAAKRQALERTQPGLPLGVGHIRTHTHDYYRHGTRTLFAALNYLEGKVMLQQWYVL